MSDSGIAAGQLKSFVERIERLETEIAELNSDKSEIYKEAKGAGFDTKALRALVAERRKDPAALSEFEAILDLYRSAVEGSSRVRAREAA
jgi:uncharacterized protein (UPF0335 family)